MTATYIFVTFHVRDRKQDDKSVHGLIDWGDSSPHRSPPRNWLGAVWIGCYREPPRSMNVWDNILLSNIPYFLFFAPSVTLIVCRESELQSSISLRFKRSAKTFYTVPSSWYVLLHILSCHIFQRARDYDSLVALWQRLKKFPLPTMLVSPSL